VKVNEHDNVSEGGELKQKGERKRKHFGLK